MKENVPKGDEGATSPFALRQGSVNHDEQRLREKPREGEGAIQLTRLSDGDQGINAGLHNIQYLRKPAARTHETPPPDAKRSEGPGGVVFYLVTASTTTHLPRDCAGLFFPERRL